MGDSAGDVDGLTAKLGLSEGAIVLELDAGFN